MRDKPVNSVARGLTVAEAKASLNISHATLYRLLGAGKLTAVKAGSRTLIESESISAYWRSLPRAEFRAPHQKAA